MTTLDLILVGFVMGVEFAIWGISLFSKPHESVEMNQAIGCLQRNLSCSATATVIDGGVAPTLDASRTKARKTAGPADPRDGGRR